LGDRGVDHIRPDPRLHHGELSTIHRFVLVRTHATAGLLVLLLSVLRVVWRITHRPPPFADDMSAWERVLAHLAHYALYGLMLAMPIGFISRWQDPFQKAMHERFVGAHSVGAWIILGLLLLHVAGALKHQWIDKHAELARMGVGHVRPE